MARFSSIVNRSGSAGRLLIKRHFMLRIEGSDAIYPMFNLSLDSHRIKQFDRFFRLLVPIEHNANRAARIEGAVIDLPRPKGTGADG
jgi:hypothetical protein